MKTFVIRGVAMVVELSIDNILRDKKPQSVCVSVKAENTDDAKDKFFKHCSQYRDDFYTAPIEVHQEAPKGSMVYKSLTHGCMLTITPFFGGRS